MGAEGKKGWQTERLGDVCEIIKGRRPVLKAAPSNGDLPYLVAKVMRGSAEAEYASVDDRNSVTVTDSETIIICDGSNSGEVFTGFRGVLSSTMGKISKKAEIDDGYLRAFLASTFEVFNGTKTGAAIPHLDKEAMYQLQFPLPPLPEQHRLVRLLDEASAGIATAKANAGKNLQNTRALFESHLQSVFTQQGEGWVERRLGEVAESISTGPFGTMLHRSDYVTDGIPLVNPMNIADSRIVPSNRMMVNEETRDRLSTYVLRKGDIVIARRGELGRCALVTEREEGWLCGTGSFFVRLSNTIDGEFFVAVFGSEQSKAHLDASSVGTTMSSLNHGILNDFVLPVPPLAEQQRIMEKAHELLSETQRLQSLYQRKLAALEDLKKSLLHQAFSGEL
jgi:type I restriction enzyme S subunit